MANKSKKIYPVKSRKAGISPKAKLFNWVKKKDTPLIKFSKFKGKEVALVEGKIVAEGKSSKEVFEKAKKLFPKKPSREIILLSVPKEEIFVYFLMG